jgi:hypothetical protein
MLPIGDTGSQSEFISSEGRNCPEKINFLKGGKKKKAAVAH